MEQQILEILKGWGPAGSTVVVVLLFLKYMREHTRTLNEIIGNHMAHCSRAMGELTKAVSRIVDQHER